MVEKLFLAGADVFRINMSHSTHEVLRERVETIRAIEKKHHRSIGVLADLQGPKLRLGEFRDGPVTLERDATFILDSDPAPGDSTRVRLPHPEILRALEPGHVVLVDDGKVRLHVLEANAQRAIAKVDVAG
jgi:pyruvate kinase